MVTLDSNRRNGYDGFQSLSHSVSIREANQPRKPDSLNSLHVSFFGERYSNERRCARWDHNNAKGGTNKESL